MNSKKFFEMAAKKGINTAELNYSVSKSFSFSLFKGEIISYATDESISLSARGIYKNKMGFVLTENPAPSNFNYMISAIINSASYIESDDEPIIFEGSKSYKKRNVYSKALENWDTDSKLKLAHELENKLIAADPRISDVEISYGDDTSYFEKTNTYGLSLKSKSNNFYIYASIVIKDGDEIKSNGKVFVDNDPAKFNMDEFVKELVEEGLAKLHGTTIKAGKYKAVLDRNCVASLMKAFISNASSESIQKHSSLFEGKLNTPVASKKITISEMPLNKNLYYTFFDSEGVAKYNKVVVEKGVLKTYFYNLGNARKDGVESTGNASGRGSKMGIGFGNLVLKPGRLSKEQLFEKIGNGIYITDINGLHAGLNPMSGDFSLQSEGFHVKDGKKAGPVTLFTVSGNLFKMFNDVIAIGLDSKLLPDGTTCPSGAFRNLKISADEE